MKESVLKWSFKWLHIDFQMAKIEAMITCE
jgi:hypothetical protein